jgi:pimeloyl-ACP methyl ester carboxylesterase
MSWPRLVLSAAIALGLATGATLWRAQAREAAATASGDHSGGFVTVDGLNVHYLQAGQGPDLVMIHGASGSLRDFTFALMPQLADRYRVTVLDRPGLGLSDVLPEGETALAAQAHHLRKAAEMLGISDPLLLGHSYGGAVSLAWALGAPPRALILVAAPSLPWPGGLDPWYRVNNSRLGRAIFVPLAAAWVPMSFVHNAIDSTFAPEPAPAGYADHMGVAFTARASVLATNVAQVNALRAQLVAMEPSYPLLTLPIELVHGDADTIVPLTIHSGPFSKHLPSAHLTVIPGAGHMPHQTHADVVIAAIDRAAARAGLR